MSSILGAAVAGAIGGGLGAGVAWSLGKILGRKPQWLSYLPIAFIGLAVGLARFSPSASADNGMAQVDVLPAIQALKAHYPEDYRRLAKAVRAASGSPERVAIAVDATLSETVVRQRPKADAETSYALYRVARLEGGLLQATDPEGCAGFMDGKGAAGLGKVLTPEVRAQDASAAQRLLVQTATKPAPLAAPMLMDALVALSGEALPRLPEAEQDTVIAVMKSERDPATREEARAMCDFNLALADTILSKPRAVAGALIRSLWAIP